MPKMVGGNEEALHDLAQSTESERPPAVQGSTDDAERVGELGG
jgi:hypothetical protein